MSAGWRVKIYSLAARSTVMTIVLEVGGVGLDGGGVGGRAVGSASCSSHSRGKLWSLPPSQPNFQLDGSSTPFPNSWALWLPQRRGALEKTPQNTPQLALQG